MSTGFLGQLANLLCSRHLDQVLRTAGGSRPGDDEARSCSRACQDRADAARRPTSPCRLRRRRRSDRRFSDPAHLVIDVRDGGGVVEALVQQSFGHANQNMKWARECARSGPQFFATEVLLPRRTIGRSQNRNPKVDVPKEPSALAPTCRQLTRRGCVLEGRRFETRRCRAKLGTGSQPNASAPVGRYLHLPD